MRLPRLLATAAAATLLLAGCTGKDAVDQSDGSRYTFKTGTDIGKTFAVPDRKSTSFDTGKLLDGGDFTLEQDAGRVVVINFWATWCGPCTVETPQFDRVYRANKAKGVDFVGIDTKDIRSKAKAFVKDNDITYPIIFDEQGETAVRLGKIPSGALPFTVVLDKAHRVAAVYLHSLTPKDLQPVLDALLAES